MSSLALPKKTEHKRLSVTFVKDYREYNRGESAGFASPAAHELVKLGIATLCTHEVKNDSNLMALFADPTPRVDPTVELTKAVQALTVLVESLKPALQAIKR